MVWLAGITDSMDMNLSKLQEMLRDRKARHAVVHGVAKSQTHMSDWTAKKNCFMNQSVCPALLLNIFVSMSSKFWWHSVQKLLEIFTENIPWMEWKNVSCWMF